MTSEHQRLALLAGNANPLAQWGPYISERQWGTVREDYSQDGNAWEYFNHDQARSRAYRWGEDGLGGIGGPQAGPAGRKRAGRAPWGLAPSPRRAAPSWGCGPGVSWWAR